MKIMTFLLGMFSCFVAYTQGQWTWVNGDPISTGYYGTKGQASDLTHPWGRSSAVSWKDQQGNFWMFGGGSSGVLNDLWKYSPTDNLWTWMSGDTLPNSPGSYGTKGVPSPSNVPRARTGSTGWTDKDGNFWLFGGSICTNEFGFPCSLNDFWKYDVAANQWTWMSGDSTANQPGSFGTKGLPSADNSPGSRMNAVSWTDRDGNFWLYGGQIVHSDVRGDLWRYSPPANEWTWISGDSSKNNERVVGEKGVASTSNHPGATSNAVSWLDKNNDLWLYGGEMRSTSSLSELWKYHPASNEWTQINYYFPVVYGDKGVPSANNAPGQRGGAQSWTDEDGNFWLFGGRILQAPQPTTFLNDLWKFNPATQQWTWFSGSAVPGQQAVYGTKGVPSANNVPAAGIYAAAWTGAAGELWLYAGVVWKFTMASSFLSTGSLPPGPLTAGSSVKIRFFAAGTFGAGNKFTAQLSNALGDFASPINIGSISGNSSDSINAVIPQGIPGGGKAYRIRVVSDNPVMTGNDNGTDLLINSYPGAPVAASPWTWVAGDNTTVFNDVYGTRGVPSPANKPASRTTSTNWTDPDGNFWLYGGINTQNTFFTYQYSDLWKYSPSTSQWTWVNGSNSPNQFPVYGTKGVEDPNNSPGLRSSAFSWVDSLGNLWLYGGNAIVRTFSSSYSATYADLWKYNRLTNAWTWVGGDSIPGRPRVYGTKGVEAPGNTPGSVSGTSGARDDKGNFWLFAPGLNDLWRLNPLNNQWTWVSGDQSSTQQGVYGSLGLPSRDNKPGSRSGSISWIDNAGNFWLFGGFGLAQSAKGSIPKGYLNDLWRYNPATTEWTWINGDSTFDVKGFYGTKNIGSVGNRPNPRASATNWKDANGNFWLFGGTGVLTSPVDFRFPVNDNYYDDLWRFNPSTYEWAWVSGDSARNLQNKYGNKGVASINNVPPERSSAVGWTDKTGNLWLFGGGRTLSTGSNLNPTELRYFNDLWEYNSNIIVRNTIVTSPINAFFLCQGAGFPVAYTATGSFGAGNIFTAQLSDPSGKFGNPVPIGSIVSGTSGVINTTIPVDAIEALGYRIRVVSSNPVVIGSDNGGDLIIRPTPKPVITASGPTVLCAGGSVTLTATEGTSYFWSNGETSRSITVTKAGSYTVTITGLVGCGLDVPSTSLPTLVAIAENPVTVSIPDVKVLSSGVDVNTVYPAYGPASSITLTALPSGGTGQFTYLWSDSSTGPAITVSPTSATIYTVKVRDAAGCEQTASKTVNVTDVSCGAKNISVQVCRVSNGNSSNGVSGCVDANEVASILAGGGYLGSCKQECRFSVKASPNPSHSYFNVNITSCSMEKITLRVFNLFGRLLETRTVYGDQVLQVGSYYIPGIYFIDVSQGGKEEVLVVIKL